MPSLRRDSFDVVAIKTEARIHCASARKLNLSARFMEPAPTDADNFDAATRLSRNERYDRAANSFRNRKINAD